MKILRIFKTTLLIVLISSCNRGESENAETLFIPDTNPSKLIKNFNLAFSKIDFGLEAHHYQFDTVSEYEPILMKGFYSHNIIDRYFFFSLISDEKTINIAVDKNGGIHNHDVYLLTTALDYDFIEEGENIVGDFTFLNQSGKSIYSDSINIGEYMWSKNFFDKRLFNIWSCIDTDGTRLKFNFTEDSLIMNHDIRIKYEKKGNKIMDDNGSLILNVIAFGEDKLLIYYNKKIMMLDSPAAARIN